MLFNITALLSGLTFGLGLILSGMTNPEKVIGFLSITQHWDPSLVFVMIGAIAVSFFAFQWAKKREKTFLGTPMHLPNTTIIDQKLVLGAALFGIGWGLAGFCPGPAVVSLTTQPQQAGLFVLSMLLGMWLVKR